MSRDEIEGREPGILGNGGIYLVADPSMPEETLLTRLEEAVKTGGICAVQLWDHWTGENDRHTVITRVLSLCGSESVPVLINNDWALLKEYPFDGVHFDSLPDRSPGSIREEIGRRVIIGVTLGNDLGLLDSPEAEGLDYISFCSVFPSASAGACELISPETVMKARSATELPVFLSGGIDPMTIPRLEGWPFEGVAVISGIMGSDRPAEAVAAMNSSLNRLKRGDAGRPSFETMTGLKK